MLLLGDPGYYGRFGSGPALPLGLRDPFAGTTETGFVIDEEDLQLVRLDIASLRATSGGTRPSVEAGAAAT